MRMLEERSYTKQELAELLGTKDRQGIKDKLDGYDVVYSIKGNGDNAVFKIKRLNDPFKVFCILELGFRPQCDFTKVRNLFWYYFNDEEFMAMPDEVKEHRMGENGHPVSRQSIAKYLEKLAVNNYINPQSGNFIYYFAYKDTQTITTREQYSKAWKEYHVRKLQTNYFEAIMRMRRIYGGVAKKQAIPDVNGIYIDKINYLNELIIRSISDELDEEIE